MSQTRKLPFVLAATDIGSLIVHRMDVSINPAGQGFGVGWDLLETAEYGPVTGEFVSKVLDARRIDHGKGVVAIDCGANVGAFTVRWAKEMTGWGRIIAIEAQERIYYCLAGNIALNNCANARAINAAVGAYDGVMKSPVPNYDQRCSFGSIALRVVDHEGVEDIGQKLDYSDAAMVNIAVVKIDSFNLERCDFIKIDVEGMEIDVIEGALETIRRCKPIILFEILKCDRPKLANTLVGLGYNISALNSANLLAIHDDDPTRRWIDVESIPPNSVVFPSSI